MLTPSHYIHFFSFRSQLLSLFPQSLSFSYSLSTPPPSPVPKKSAPLTASSESSPSPPLSRSSRISLSQLPETLSDAHLAIPAPLTPFISPDFSLPKFELSCRTIAKDLSSTSLHLPSPLPFLSHFIPPSPLCRSCSSMCRNVPGVVDLSERASRSCGDARNTRMHCALLSRHWLCTSSPPPPLITHWQLQGMSYIAATLLLFMKPPEAFASLCLLLSTPFYQSVSQMNVANVLQTSLPFLCSWS